MPQRSPLVFWLLLAATLVIDAVAIYWVTSPYPLHARVFYDGLVLGQLSVIFVWSALAVRKDVWTRLAPLLAVAVASVAIGLLDESPWTVGLPYYGLYAAMLLAALWVFERTPFWRRRRGAATSWRYSMANLLIVMTIIAVLASVIRNSPLFEQHPGVNLLFLCSSVAVAMASVVLWSLTWHWLLRLAAVLGFAEFVGGTLFWFALQVVPLPLEVLAPLLVFIVAPPHLIQALVLSAWLGLTPILPVWPTSAAES